MHRINHIEEPAMNPQMSTQLAALRIAALHAEAELRRQAKLAKAARKDRLRRRIADAGTLPAPEWSRAPQTARIGHLPA